jgi:hypothetical protein
MELQNTVKEALNALYHHPDDAVRMQADRWLQDFQRTLDAWQVLRFRFSLLFPQLLIHESKFGFIFLVCVLFFCVTAAVLSILIGLSAMRRDYYCLSICLCLWEKEAICNSSAEFFLTKF